MSDLDREEDFYRIKNNSEWSKFNCFSFFLSCKQSYIINNILTKKKLNSAKVLDIGAGEGNFILKLISLGIRPKNIVAIEYLEDRYLKLREKLPNIQAINEDFLKVNLSNKYDIVTIMAVLTSITDNNIRYKILEKALDSLSENGTLILYDFFDDKEKYLNVNYRAISLSKILNLSQNYKVKTYKRVYLKNRYIKGLCKFKLSIFIPLIESLKIFNDNYHFVVIKNEN